MIDPPMGDGDPMSEPGATEPLPAKEAIEYLGTRQLRCWARDQVGQCLQDRLFASGLNPTHDPFSGQDIKNLHGQRPMSARLIAAAIEVASS